jgi:methionyl-tRNA formyltransferase
MFFIGAPIGALVRRGGLGVPAIISVLFFVLYYIVDTIGSKLAKDGAITGAEGAFIATAVLVPIGAYLTWKAVNDASLSGSDTLKNQWRKFKRKVINLFRKSRIVFMGTPEFAVASLDKLVGNGYKVAGVVTVADKPSGRGLSMNESAVKKYAVEHGIPVLQPLKLKDPEFLEQLKAWKADLFVVVAFRMLPEEVWKMPKLGTFNLHAALLPQYRGAAPINWAVINGESMTGVTTFMIDKDIDTGGIILREEYKIAETDTAGDVHDALMGMGADLVLETVRGILDGTAETRIQRSFIQGAETLRPAPKLTRALCHIDWNDSSRHICNLILGLSPYPTAYTELTDGVSAPVQLKVFEAEKMAWDGPEAPGTLLTDGKSYLAVRSADGAVSLKNIQLSGKKRMDVGAFLLGFRDAEKYHCTEGTSKAEIAKTRANA